MKSNRHRNCCRRRRRHARRHCRHRHRPRRRPAEPRWLARTRRPPSHQCRPRHRPPRRPAEPRWLTRTRRPRRPQMPLRRPGRRLKDRIATRRPSRKATNDTRAGPAHFAFSSSGLAVFRINMWPHACSLPSGSIIAFVVPGNSFHNFMNDFFIFEVAHSRTL